MHKHLLKNHKGGDRDAIHQEYKRQKEQNESEFPKNKFNRTSG